MAQKLRETWKEASVEQQNDKVDSAIEPNFDSATVRNRLAALSASTATDLDVFFNTLLCDAADGLVLLLSLIFHRGYQEGIVPVSWRTATVITVYKGKGSK